MLSHTYDFASEVISSIKTQRTQIIMQTRILKIIVSLIECIQSQMK